MKTVNSNSARIVFDLILLSAVFYTPWWAVAILAFVGAFLWPPYYEIFICGLLVDLLYGARMFSLGGIFGIVGSMIIYFVASHVKKIVR